MKTNREIRQEAWRLVRTKWFWRLLAVGLVLNLIAQAANRILSCAFRQMEIQTWQDFCVARLEAARAGLTYAVPSFAIARQMTGATAFQTFVAYVFAAIVAFGLAGVLLKATRDDEARWFAGSFGGFSRPLEVTWLMVLMNLRVFLWSFLFVIPGLVAVYRYRQAWYLKNEHPAWSASRCLAESGRLMKGHKWAACSLDCSFVGWFVLAGMLFSATAFVGGSPLQSALAGLAGFAGLYLLLFVVCYFFAARTIFYREVAAQVPLAD